MLNRDGATHGNNLLGRALVIVAFFAAVIGGGVAGLLVSFAICSERG